MAGTFKSVPDIQKAILTVAIPDSVCEQSGLNLAWSGDNKFGAYAFDSAHSYGSDQKSRYAPCEDKVHETRIRSVLFHPIARKLVSESCGYFVFAQKLGKKSRSTDFPLEVLKLSRLYRSVLRICLEGFQTEAELCPPEEKASYLQHIPTFYNMELVWHLCEILFIDVLPGHLVLSQLISWIRFHIPHVEKEAQKLLSLGKGVAEEQDNYWLVIIDCLLQRRIDIARALLILHSKASHEPFQLMEHLLRTMPIFEIHGGLTGTEFQVRHDCWKKEASRLQRTGAFTSLQYLDIISKIIIGEDSVEDTVKRHCETWYQHMIASLIYTAPAAKVFDLSFHANRSITLYGGPDAIHRLDWILCSIMEMDMYKMVERASEWADSDWLLAHLIHLLHLLGKLSVSGPTDVGSQLLESLLVSYGSLMMSHSSLWQVGVDYLDHCPVMGQGVLETLLSQIPFKTNQKALKIVHIAAEHGLSDVVYQVAKVRGLECWRLGHLGPALTWAMRSEDPAFCSKLADAFLQDYMKTGKFQAIDLLENLGCEMMFGDRLVFLGKYCEFLRMKKSGELSEAASLIVLLLKNKVPPKYFWLQVFIDTMPILETGKSVLGSADIFDLLSSFQEMSESASDLKLELPSNEIIKIRTCLAKNLASAMVTEGTGPLTA